MRTTAPNWIDPLRTAKMRRPHQQRDARKAQHKADENTWAGTTSPGTQPVQNNHPQRNGGHKQRSDARGHSCLGPRQRTVAAEQQQQARDDGSAPLRSRWLFFTLITEERIENQPDGDVTNASKYKRWNRLNSDADKEIRRAPQNIDRRERDQNPAARNRGSSGNCGRNCRERRGGRGAHLLNDSM